MHKLLTLAMLLLLGLGASAQSGEDVVRGDKPITWLGLDFSKTACIGSATQFKDAGEITGTQVRDKYAPGWNQLFLDEAKKFDVAKAVHREAVSYALEVTAKPNGKIDERFFQDDPSAYQHLSEKDIQAAVKGYDFKGRHGVGFMIFIEGMYKGREEAAGWVTFVDMDKKTVIRSFRSTAKPGGFGFRNYWAKAFLNIMKDADRK